MRKKIALWISILTVVVLLVSGVAYASIPDANGVIHGCRKNSDGSVRVVDSDVGQTCASGWTAMNWNQTGPSGATGPQGATGAQGPAGTDGASGYEVVIENVSRPSNEVGTTEGLAAACPEGKVVTGAGGAAQSFGSSGTYWLVEYSRPAFNVLVNDVWQMQFRQQGSAPTTNTIIEVRAICITAD